MSMVFKKIVKFLCCFIAWMQDFIKKLCKTMVFFCKKNWDIWNPKFQQNSIIYYFFFILSAFSAFCFLFHLSKFVHELWNFLWCFTRRIRDFTSDFWNILKVLLKKLLICEIFFFENSAVYYLFFSFCIVFDILFSISSISTCQKIKEIFRFFYFMV